MSRRILSRHSPYVRFDLKVVEGSEGFHACLIGTTLNGHEVNLLPLDAVPAMKTRQDAEELGCVVIWQEIKDTRDYQGNPLSPLA